jgi:hypothetical protein
MLEYLKYRWLLQHTIELNLLRYRQLYITGTWRQIKDENIESAPFDLMQKLLKCLHDHETPPCDRGRFWHKIAHGHRLQSIVREWDQLVVCLVISTAAVDRGSSERSHLLTVSARSLQDRVESVWKVQRYQYPGHRFSNHFLQMQEQD